MKRTLSLIIIVCWLFAACQATPEKEIVIKKDFPEEVMNPEEHKSGDIFSYESGYLVPEEIDEAFQSENNDLKVRIESDVVIPNATTFPVILIKNRLLSQEEVDKIIFFLVKDTQLYEDKEKDRQDFSDDITYFKGILAKIKAKETKTHLDEVRIEKYQKVIKVFESDMKEAPEKIERLEATTELIQSATETNHKYIRLEADKGKTESAKLYVDLSIGTNSSYLEYINLNIAESIKLNEAGNNMNSYDASNLNNPNELEITVDDARIIAQNAADNMGFENYEINTVGIAYKESFINYEYYYDCAQCYAFYFTPIYEKIPLTYEATQGAYNDFSKGWMYESLIICIDDTGVIYVKLTEPSMEIEKIRKGAKLIEFDKILDIFSKQIMIQGAWNNVVEVKSRTLHIDEITLGYMKIAVPDNPDEFILTPVWDFFGYEETEYDENTYTALLLDENNKYKTRTFRHSYLTINAIDGSIIDRTLGY